MNLHLLNLPHTETVKNEYSWCAYTEKVRKFCHMMSPYYDIVLYAGQRNDAPVKEHVVIMSDENRELLCDGYKQAIPFDINHKAFSFFNTKAAEEINKRLAPGDLVLVIGGLAQKPIAEALPSWATVIEWGIGYAGTFANFRVFESHAWRHHIQGVQGGYDPDGRFYDAVIPNFFEKEDFDVGEPGDYFLFMGRMTERKGPHIAEDVCRHLDVPIIYAGEGHWKPTYGDSVGHVSPDERKKLMSNAIATFTPTYYIEPFGGVAVESLLCGTPVIATDFGAFTETIQEQDGWRCRNLAEFTIAARIATATKNIGRHERRQRAIDRYSLEVIAPQYNRYFGMIEDLIDGRDFNWMP